MCRGKVALSRREPVEYLNAAFFTSPDERQPTRAAIAAAAR
jgi:hypothetical protein